MENDEYMKISAGYTRPMSQDFESNLRTDIDLIEDDIRLLLDNGNSSFITYEIQPIFTLLKIFPKSLLTYFNLNIQDLAT